MTSLQMPVYRIFLLFGVTLFFVPLVQISWLNLIPGDIGDARLNAYFLENIYQYLAGRSESLWNLGFFSPFPYVLGFSDNLFGSSPVYLLARVLIGQSDTAFQIWYLFGYVANFFSAYYALNRLGSTPIASAVGALIFTFALPVTAHSGHAQLHYRFGVPLSIAMFILFLDKKNWRYFVAAGAWLVWQFYCTIYIGFFTLLMLAAISIVYFVRSFRSKTESPRDVAMEFVRQWRGQTSMTKLRFVLDLFLLLSLLTLLFYPYLRVTQLYGASRSLGEIASMLPRPQSYFLSDGSWFWSSHLNIFADIPMRHEHQMFVGAIPLLLAVMGFLLGSRDKNGIAFPLLAGSLAGVILLTLYVGGFSLWYFFAKLPLASAIRAMARIDQVLLFPIAYLAAVAISSLSDRPLWMSRLVFAIVIPMMIFEFSATSPGVSAKREWRERLVANEARFPTELPPNPIIFFAQSEGPFYAAELDAMWVALKHGVPTLNGYSGLYPSGFSSQYGNDCSELPKRVLSYVSFSGLGDPQKSYIDLMRRVVPIGFIGCDEQWWKAPPALSTTDSEYSDEEIRNLSLEYVGRIKQDDDWIVDLQIENAGDRALSAISSLGKPIRLSWRFVDSSGTPTSGWDTRKDLPFDISPQSALNIRLAIDSNMEVKGGTLQISLVQEGVFWAHDIGLAPLTVPWN